ncbi:MAG TPA: hypothetical protein VHV31_03505 [Nitrolancea sp.]|jgi:hypothetical protein|nr:hypothetical protein [Nitrolancea sp.]
MGSHTADIDVYLHRLRIEVTELPALASMIADEPPDVRDVWHWQWDELLADLTRLCEGRAPTGMSTAQEREFMDLMGQLSAARPALEVLGLCVPEFDSPRQMRSAKGLTNPERGNSTVVLSQTEGSPPPL